MIYIIENIRAYLLFIYLWNYILKVILKFFFFLIKSDETVGDVFLNGQPVDQEIMARISGFVPQEDLSIETLTVQEHMEFMVS